MNDYRLEERMAAIRAERDRLGKERESLMLAAGCNPEVDVEYGIDRILQHCQPCAAVDEAKLILGNLG